MILREVHVGLLEGTPFSVEVHANIMQLDSNILSLHEYGFDSGRFELPVLGN